MLRSGRTGRLHPVGVGALSPVGAYPIDAELVVTENGQPITLDVEGLAARPDGGFVLAVEGEDGPDNQLVWVAADGVIERRAAAAGRRGRPGRGSGAGGRRP